MFKNLFKKANEIILYSPVKGNVIDITEVPDPVFSEKMMGEGVAIIPEDNTICSPFDGQVIQIFKTKHALSLKSIDEIELIIHVGLETVNLNGEGFEVLVHEGDNIIAGQKLLKVDFELLKNKGLNIITPIVIINHADKNIKKYFGFKSKEDILMRIL